MKKELEFEINSVYLGIKKAKNPKKDRDQYLKIDEFDVNITKNKIYIIPKKWHIKEYDVNYCVECLKEGKRNKNWFSGGENGYWCKKHYTEKMKKEKPDSICPKCGNGIIQFGTFDNYCTNCNYREPHVHDITPPSSSHTVPIFTSTIRGDFSTFTCTCLGWETPEQHKTRREALKKVKT